MKISVNDQELFSLTEFQKKVIKYNVHADEFEDDMKRRLQWIIMHKYEHTLNEMKKEWEPILIANGATSVPTDLEKYALLVFDQPNYKDRKARQLEADALRQAR
jgi:hypothetical protein